MTKGKKDMTVRPCSSGCNKRHNLARWAALTDKSEKTLYLWRNPTDPNAPRLDFDLEGGTVLISHEQMNDFHRARKAYKLSKGVSDSYRKGNVISENVMQSLR